MKPATPKTDVSTSTQRRKVVFGGFLKEVTMCLKNCRAPRVGIVLVLIGGLGWMGSDWLLPRTHAQTTAEAERASGDKLSSSDPTAAIHQGLSTLPYLTRMRSRSICAENPTGGKGQGGRAVPDPTEKEFPGSGRQTSSIAGREPCATPALVPRCTSPAEQPRPALLAGGFAVRARALSRT